MFYPIHLTEESINAVIIALRRLPHYQVHDLVMDIAAQRDQAMAKVEPELGPEVEAE